MNSIKNANNWFNNIFLTEMARPKKEVIKKISAFSDSIMEHIIKCVVYKNSTNNFLHWVNEISNFLSIINDYETKSMSGKLRYNEYLNTVFYKQGNSELDMKQNLRVFSLNKNYPSFKIDNKLVKQLWNIFRSIAEKCSVIFSDKNNSFDENKFKDLILDIFTQYEITF